ncbi:MurR/RpiR family transcriptional regulator [Leekyejoonella antrihumi]|nr:MurR/RpiR family transcriptional regulator [Leekyejoonella antrihumi]
MRSRRHELTTAELRIMQAILRDYPAAGLQSVAAFAGDAGVSPPTVVRFTAKLGFPTHAQFQAQLRAEVSARSAGPAQLYATTDHTKPGTTVLHRCEQQIGCAVIDTLHTADDVDFARAVNLTADPSRPVLITGGRVSAALALYLATSLQMLRPGVRYLEPQQGARTAALLDLTHKYTVVTFDYRRYERDTVRFGTKAAGQGGKIVLFTDTYLSPLARDASAVVATSVDGPGPLACLTPAFAMIDALLVAASERDTGKGQRRLTQYDDLSHDTVN